MIQIESNSRDVLDAFDELQRSVVDLRPAMADIAQVLASKSERQFRSESGPSGDAWPDLTDTTKAMREKHGKWPGKKLQVSAGGLAASVQTGFDETSAWIGSNKPYAAMHQFGGVTSPRSMIPGKTIEARPFLPFDPVDQTLGDDAISTILEVIQHHLGQAFNS